MNIDFIGILALIWVVYIFLFTEADTEIFALLSRLRFSLSTDSEGNFDPAQYGAKQAMGVDEILELGKVVDQKHSSAKIVKKFEGKYQRVNRWKRILVYNLFALNGNIILFKLFSNTVNSQWYWIVLGHLGFSFLISLLFYFQLGRIAKTTKFTRIVLNKQEISR